MIDKQKRKAMSMEIAQRLAAIRREKGFSQEELAGQLGLSRQAVSKWERGESAPDMGNLIALADLYGMTLDELVRGEAPTQAAEAEPIARTTGPEKVDVTINNCPPPAPQTPPVFPAYPQTPPASQPPSEPKPTSEIWMTFPYPLFCALLYLVLGFVFGLWHPGWIIFLTIPFFYWIVHVVKQDPNYVATHTPDGQSDPMQGR